MHGPERTPREAGPDVANGLTYRPDIDGLRGIAVLSVVIFHAFPAALPGGFAGVDIFFVISGYLISGIILTGTAAGSFSLRDFYRRRVNRLFPSLVVVLAACLAGGYAYFLSDEFIQLCKHSAAGAAFVQNISLWQESDYFDLASIRKPLLHLWTLAIEEQFYLAYPLLLLALARWTARPLPAIILLAVASFIANVTLIDGHPIAVFYCFGSRAWELLAGGLLVCLERAPGYSARRAAWSGRVGDALGWSGLILLAIAFSCLAPGLAYPGWWGTLAVAGSVLVMAAGPQAFPNARLLSHPVLVGSGLISYPLYLWHWPLLSFWAVVEPEADSVGVRAALVLASVVLALLSYRLLERPLRRNHARWVTPGLAAAMAGVAVVGVLGWTQVLPSRFAMSHFDQLVHHASGDWRFPGRMTTAFLGEVAYATAGGQGRMTLVWGDSHAAQYGPRLEQLVKGNPLGGRGVMFLTLDGAPPLPGVVMDGDRPWCAGNVQRFRLLADDPRVDTIVVAARWSAYFEPVSGYSFEADGHAFHLDTDAGRQRALAALDGLLAGLAGTGRTIYLVQDNPSARELDPTYIYQRGFLTGGFRIRAEGVAAQTVLRHDAPIRSELAAIAARLGLRVIDPLTELVKDGRFPAVSDQGVPLYKDTNHLRATTVRNLIRYLDVTVQDAPR
jgi:peptidoglycan/LPS O-acetylase OafA/YrhL